jgi:thiol-disulfide isomerase/thioredoxin
LATGYLYLIYDEIRDSSIIDNGRAFFKGTVSSPTLANFGTDYASANDKNFYLENTEIESEITISKKQLPEINIDWIIIDDISGTETVIMEKDFDDFELKFSTQKDWQNRLYIKLQSIIKENPKHRYSGDLLCQISYDSVLSKEQVGELFNMLSIETQDPFVIKRIRANAFPENIINNGDSIYDFALPDEENNLVSTKDFRGQLLFIDFWASWCKPCRAQFPELIEINNVVKDKGFSILGVSIDEKKDDWTKAMDQEKPRWKNVIDTVGLTGDLAKKYGIFGIPYNVLANENGNVIATDISLMELKNVLDSLITD